MKKPPPVKRPQQPNNPPQQNHHHQISLQTHSWKAPLPPPEVLERFNQVVPNGAERIVKAWELESEHRRLIDRREQKLFYADSIFGKICALIFVLAALGFSAWCAWIGAEWVGAILGAGTIASVVWAFNGKKEDK
jgi:uncharacterized membrane protein